MRIAFITYEYPPSAIGGAGVYASNLTKELVKLGNTVVVFTPEVEYPQLNNMDGLKIIHVKVNRHYPLISLQFWTNLPKILKIENSIEKFDIVHINGTSYWFIPGKIIDVPHVITVHHLSRDAKGYGQYMLPLKFRLVGESSIIYQYLEKRGVRFADRIIAVSKFTKNRIEETYNIMAENIVVIYNGYEPPRFEVTDDQINNFKKKFNLDSRPIILFVGRIDDPRKGLDILLQAFSHLFKKLDSQLLIVGKGNDRLVSQKAIKYGIKENIILTGYLNPQQLACSYTICDVFVCPSLMEGFGFTILDSVYFGKRVVTTNIGAIPEIAPEGTIFVNANHKELMGGIISAIAYNYCKVNINMKHLNNFTWEKCGIKTQQIYSKLIVDSKHQIG